jgi:hypothetical protein
MQAETTLLVRQGSGPSVPRAPLDDTPLVIDTVQIDHRRQRDGRMDEGRRGRVAGHRTTGRITDVGHADAAQSDGG